MRRVLLTVQASFSRPIRFICCPTGEGCNRQNWTDSEVCRNEVLNEAMLLEAFLETGALRSATEGSAIDPGSALFSGIGRLRISWSRSLAVHLLHRFGIAALGRGRSPDAWHQAMLHLAGVRRVSGSSRFKVASSRAVRTTTSIAMRPAGIKAHSEPSTTAVVSPKRIAPTYPGCRTKRYGPSWSTWWPRSVWMRTTLEKKRGPHRPENNAVGYGKYDVPRDVSRQRQRGRPAKPSGVQACHRENCQDAGDV